MRQRSNLIILFGIAFFLVGGALVYLVISDDGDGGGGGGSASSPQVAILIAKEDIPANTTGAEAVEQGLLDTRTVTAGNQPTGALTSASALDNQIFALAVDKGTAITTAQLATRSLSNVSVPEGYEAVAVDVAYVSGGAGYVAPGDRVNVFGVYGDPAYPLRDAGIPNPDSITPRTELALTNVLVLDVSSQQATSAQTTDAAGNPVVSRPAVAGGSLTYLLALRTTDVERVVHLDQFAAIYLSLQADDAPPSDDTVGVAGANANDTRSADSAAPIS